MVYRMISSEVRKRGAAACIDQERGAPRVNSFIWKRSRHGVMVRMGAVAILHLRGALWGQM